MLEGSSVISSLDLGALDFCLLLDFIRVDLALAPRQSPVLALGRVLLPTL